MGPLTLLAAERKQQSALNTHTHTHTQSYTRSMRNVVSTCASHHSSPSAPAQVPPGNIARTAAWRSRRHLSADGKKNQLNSLAESNIKINYPINMRSA